jgi:4'-phosphopantetheinyl transferase EntD
MNSPDLAFPDDSCSPAPEDMEACAELLRRLFPRRVGAAAVGLKGTNFPLFPGEERFVAGAVEKRRREYAAGRHCARQALSQLGFPPAAIPSAPDRSPFWPAGALGSVSHDESLCVAVAAKHDVFRSIGVDVEVIGAVGPEMAREILRLDEQPAPEARPSCGADWLTLHFCLKEAAYKAFYPLYREVIGFQQMRIRLQSTPGHFRAEAAVAGSPSFEGRYSVHGGRIFAVAW